MSTNPPKVKEWLLPLAFVFCAGWVIWHIPAFLLDLLPYEDRSLYGQIKALHETKDISAGMPGLFGGFADPIDWAAMILTPVFFIWGALNVRCAPMEYPHWRPVDRVALFLGRVTMVLILLMSMVMMYEVFLRYAFEAPTLWANELTLWIAGFVFLCAGLYAMQQRCHIRIFLLYDAMPRRVQHVFDILSAAFFTVFAFFLVYGSYSQIFLNKFYRWEMFGTAFDPPIPATIQPAILILIVLIAVQNIVNLISDWNLEPGAHTAADSIDKDEIEAIKRSAGQS